jgi:hypothetical protein
MENQLNFGMELTFLSKYYPDDIELYKDFVKDRLESLSISVYDISIDEECLEISTNTYSSINKFKEDFTKIYNLTKSLSLYPSVEGQDGGGGHIHLDKPNLRTRCNKNLFDYNLSIYLTQRPYLNWFFNEYNDMNSAEPNILKYKFFKRHFKKDFQKELSKTFYDINFRLGDFISPNKGYTHTTRTHHAEIRIFKAPENIQEALLNLKFCTNLFHYISKISKQEQVLEFNHINYQTRKHNKTYYIEQFIKDLKHLKLNPDKYIGYTLQNYAYRWEYKYFFNALIVDRLIRNYRMKCISNYSV